MNGRRAIAVAVGFLVGCAATEDRCDDCLPKKSLDPSYHACPDTWITKLTAKECAERDLKQHHCGGKKPSKHFRSGFEQAYVDLALGRRAVAPPIPPPKYWNAYYRSCEGDHAVTDWFAGYDAGLQSGQYSGVSRFNRVANSWATREHEGAPPAGGCPTCGPAGR